MTDSPDRSFLLSHDPQFAEGRGFERMHHVNREGGNTLETELAVNQQRRFAGRLVGFYDLLRQKKKTGALGAMAIVMKEFADSYPDFLIDPQTEEQQRLASLYESIMNGDTDESN